MATLTATPRLKRSAVPAEPARAFDRRQAEILRHAAEVFCDKGYDAASMRDLARATGMSLAGLYHYFESKEKLLYQIQRQSFVSVLEQLREKLAGERDPEQRIRIFLRNHLEYFLANQKAMKVMSHEATALQGDWAKEVRAVKRDYYNACLALVDELKRQRGLEFESRIAVLSLFGMVNWIYTWHNPRTDADASALAQQMGDIFLQGINGPPKRRRK